MPRGLDYANAAEKYGFLGTPQGNRFLGVELEVEVGHGFDYNDGIANIRAAAPDFLTFKEDGSLDDGFEMNTAPASLEIHREKWRWLQNSDLTRGLTSTDNDTCGMHVHLAVKSLTAPGYFAAYNFINAPGNRPFLRRIAGRESNRWAAFHNLDQRTPVNAVAVLLNSGQRYSALNFLPKSTVEFRLFNGTLKYESLMRRVEFVDALGKFANTVEGIYPEPKTAREFVTFLAQNADRYPEINTWIEARRTAGRPITSESGGRRRSGGSR